MSLAFVVLSKSSQADEEGRELQATSAKARPYLKMLQGLVPLLVST